MTRELLLLFFTMTAPAHAKAVDPGVSAVQGQPGYYGRLDVRNMPRPVLVQLQPVTIQPARKAARQSQFVRVPREHRKQWNIHCYKCDACSQPVYFVQDRWYDEVYVPHHRQRHESQVKDFEHPAGPQRARG